MTPRANPGHREWLAVKKLTPIKVPRKIKKRNTQSLLISKPKSGPEKSCHKLVMKAGRINKLAASTGAIKRLKKPMAKVCNPMPETPLIAPLKIKIAQTVP